MKITVIGAGNMGGAMIKGWAKNGEHELTITARTEKTLARFKEEFPSLKTSLDNAEAVKGADIIRNDAAVKIDKTTFFIRKYLFARLSKNSLFVNNS